MDNKNIIDFRKKRGKALQLARRKNKVSKIALSAITGISRCTIDRMESGKTSWTVDTEIIYLDGLKLGVKI